MTESEKADHVIDIPREVSAIRVRNAVKRYGASTPVLNHLHLSAPVGSIYSLLGPSGCGKTTLLKCILGLTSVDSGEVRVFGEETNVITGRNTGSQVDVGYMPQELALSGQLTIKETLWYYGTVAGMTRSQIKIKIKHLIEMLQLPSLNRLVCQMSGGQQRRVSFATALLHDSKLLILDEPTVGVDPPLRKKMWLYLNDLVNTHGRTVVITTHYIEEARSSNIVGMMFKGQLLVEAPPEQLIMERGKSNLEDVFLQLVLASNQLVEDSSIDEESSQLLNTSTIAEASATSETDDKKDAAADLNTCSKSVITRRDRYRSFLTRCCSKDALMDSIYAVFQPISLRRLSAIFFKDLAQMSHNMGIIFYIVAVLIIVTLCCLAVTGEFRNIKIAVIDEDKDAISNLFLKSIDARIIHQIPFNDTSLAYKALHNGDVSAFIKFNKNFTNQIAVKYMYGLHTDEVLEDSKVILAIDPKNGILKGATLSELLASLTRTVKTLMNYFGFTSSVGELPVQLTEPLFGYADATFRNFMVPGIIILLTLFMSMDVTSTTMLEEKQCGQLERSIVSGVNVLEIVIGTLIARSMVIIAETFFLLLIPYGLFGIRVELSGLLMAIPIILSVGMAGLSYGLLLSAIGTQQVANAIVVLFTIIPLVLISGVLWPLEGLSPVMMYISTSFPAALSVEATRTLVGRGWGFYGIFWKALGINSIWFTVLITICILVLKPH